MESVKTVRHIAVRLHPMATMPFDKARSADAEAELFLFAVRQPTDGSDGQWLKLEYKSNNSSDYTDLASSLARSFVREGKKWLPPEDLATVTEV